jgi:branched-chain amino acid transport system substrate-binding protein
MRIFKTISACLIAIFVGSTLFSASADTPQRKYRIAVIIPLTGPVASLGLYVKRGIDLSYEGLPKETRALVDITYQDDQFDPIKTVTAYRGLKGSSSVDAVFVIGSSTANALSPILERDKTILLAIGASDPTIAVGKKFSFIHWVIPSVLGEKLAPELKRRDFKRIGFISAESSGAIADTEAAIESLKKIGLGDRIVYHQTFDKGETNFQSAFVQLRDKKADAVVALLFPGALSSFAKQFKAMQLPAELVGMETFEDEGEVKAAQGALLGAWYVNASDPTDEFVQEYKARYNEHPGWGTGNGYDSLRLVVNAVKSVGTDNNKVREYLGSIKDYSGATGKFSSSGDNRFTLPAALKKITDKGFEPLLAPLSSNG